MQYELIRDQLTRCQRIEPSLAGRIQVVQVVLVLVSRTFCQP